MMRRKSVTLVWLEAVDEGTAPRYHLRGTIRRLLSGGLSRGDMRLVIRTGERSKFAAARMLALGAMAGPKSRNIICRWHPLILPLVAIWRFTGCRVILLVQGTFSDAVAAHPRYASSRAFYGMAIASLRMAHSVIAPHPGIATWVDSVLKEGRALVLPNGAPLVKENSEERLSLPPLPERYVAFVGSLATWQGVPVLLDALNADEWPDDVELVVAGDGKLREHVEAFAATDSRVHYVGAVPPIDAREILRGSISSISPKVLDEVTKHGVSPFKLLEAGCESKMIIASRVPGQTEFIEKWKCGMLVESGDPQALASAVRYAATHPLAADEMGTNGAIASQAMAWEADAHVLLGELSR